MDYFAMGQRICRFRKELRLTQEQLAEQADISASFLGHVERGTRIASLETVMKLCAALRVTPNDLLVGKAASVTADLPACIRISPARLLEGIAEMLTAQEIPE